ncbi:MAG: SH3 domain-containing protein [Clostridiales bacterium]|nr:SH3 domain-containing protein [Clostridiales bacterium]
MAIKKNVEKEVEKKVEVVEEPKVEIKEEPKEVIGIYITNTLVNFREKPNLKANVIRVLQKDEKIKVSKIEKGWASVEFNGTNGYIKSEFITKK